MTDSKPHEAEGSLLDGPVPAVPLIGVVVVTHGQLATELVIAAEMIAGDLPHFAAVSIGCVRRPAGVLVLTDMFGGTPSNLGITFLARDKVEVITGVNLPMLIKLTTLRGSSNLMEVARRIREAARDAIWVVSDVMG
jgi:mannose PTS system EIIA component